MAVGVASTSAQGQNTTRMVTARMISPVTSHVPAAAVRAMTTIQVAHRSARRTILALPASADCTSSIMRASELSSPTRWARMSNAPNWFTVPLFTSSPGALSTGSDSPVITDSSMEVRPSRTVPSTATVSPGSTRSTSPTCTSSAATTVSTPSRTMRAVRGDRCTSRSMPARAFATVRSSSSAPSCMMSATSPAAKSSPMATAAMSASDTSTSALMSNSVTSPMTAPRMMGAPHSTMAIQAGLKGSVSGAKKLNPSATADTASSATSFFVPPRSSSSSSRSSKGARMAIVSFMSSSPVHFGTYGGIGIILRERRIIQR